MAEKLGSLVADIEHRMTAREFWGWLEFLGMTKPAKSRPGKHPKPRVFSQAELTAFFNNLGLERAENG